MNKVVTLARVSTVDQANDDRAGIPRQLQAIKQAIKTHNLESIKDYILKDVSGTNILETSEFNEIISFMEQGVIAGLVLADIDRLTRPKDFSDLLVFQYFMEHGCLIYLPHKIIDFNEDDSFLQNGILSMFAGAERKKILRRIYESKEIKRKNGEHPNSDITLPQGVQYNRSTKQWSYDGLISNKIKHIFEEFVLGNNHNYQELARKHGYSGVTIKNILQNKIYIGTREYTKKRGLEKYYKADGRQADRKKINRTDDIITVENLMPPLISIEIFQKAQDIISTKNTKSRKKRQGNRFLFNSLLKCGVCGEKIYTSSGGDNPSRDYYVCKSIKHNTGCNCDAKHHRRDRIDASICNLVSNQLTDETFINSLLSFKHHKSVKDDLNNTIDDLKEKITQVKRELSKLLDLYLKDCVVEEIYIKKERNLKQQLLSLESTLKDMELEHKFNNEQIEKAILDNFQEVLFDFEFLNDTDKKNITSLLFSDFTLSKNGQVTAFSSHVSHNQSHMDRGS